MRREVHYQEDLWTPGTFELTLNPRETTCTGELRSPTCLTNLPEPDDPRRSRDLRALDQGTDHSIAVRSLTIRAG